MIILWIWNKKMWGKTFWKKFFPTPLFKNFDAGTGQGEIANLKYGFIWLCGQSLAETAEMRYTWGMKPVSAFFYSKENPL
jgi:hypothetical protein